MKNKMIPKKIFQVWLGKQNPMPVEWMDTVKNMYKELGWEYFLITDNNLPALVNYDIFHNETRNHTKCNLLRYELIYNNGGFFIDSDMIALRPLPDEILDNEFVTAYESEKYTGNLIPSAFFGATAKHPILKELIDNMKNQDQSLASWKFNGTQYFTDTIEKYQGSKKIYPSYIVQPYHFRDKMHQPAVKKEVEERMTKAFFNHLWGTTTRQWKTDKL